MKRGVAKENGQVPGHRLTDQLLKKVSMNFEDLENDPLKSVPIW